MSEEKYLIESIEHKWGDAKVWWKPNRLGYTDDIGLAGRYSLGEATEICEKAGPDNERMWPESDVLNGKAGRVIKVVIE